MLVFEEGHPGLRSDSNGPTSPAKDTYYGDAYYEDAYYK
jgi:hypothetical protein